MIQSRYNFHPCNVVHTCAYVVLRASKFKLVQEVTHSCKPHINCLLVSMIMIKCTNEASMYAHEQAAGAGGACTTSLSACEH
eukprot:scaffold75835_cov28-Tisochrysis_lutea.AAC.1